MDQIIGKNIKLIINGHSHLPTMSITIKNFPKGLKVDYDLINKNIEDRKSPYRIEKDDYYFRAGLNNNITDGNDIIIEVKNSNYDSSKYNNDILRPNHADYVAINKYKDINMNGGAFFSGRLTILYVIAGSLFEQLLKKENILVYSHIKQIFNHQDDKLNNNIEEYNYLSNKKLKVLNNDFEKYINNTLNDLEDDSFGAIIETTILNLPLGIGSPFESIESILSYYLFTIGGIKGIEFGLGFDFVNYKGSEVLDTLEYQNDKIIIKNNYNGGINGGISNGNPVNFKVIVKPTPTIHKEIKTVNIKTKENVLYKNEGYHDKCIGLRIPVIINAITYIALYDLIKSK